MSLTDKQIKHQVFLDRLARGYAKEYQNTIRTVLNYITRNLRKELSPTQLFEIELGIRSRFQNGTAKMFSNFEQFLIYESEFLTNLLNKELGESVIKKPTPDMLKKAVGDTPIQTTFTKVPKSLNETYKEFENKKTQDYMRILQDGQTLQEDKKTIQRKVEEKSSGLISTQSLVLTGLAILALSGRAKEEIQKVNTNIEAPVQPETERVELRRLWISVLEDNTCPYCIARHEESSALNGYKLGEFPAFPAHGKCQCSDPIVTIKL